jgi:hypothetical protein
MREGSRKENYIKGEDIGYDGLKRKGKPWKRQRIRRAGRTKEATQWGSEFSIE